MKYLFADHPSGLRKLAHVEVWERFSFYGTQAVLILYMTSRLSLGDAHAYGIYAGFMSLFYAAPLIGGALADNVLGNRRAIFFGTVLFLCGQGLLLIYGEQWFYLALAFIVCGNGFYYPNMNTLLGRLYTEDDPKRDAGFTLFYTATNIGGFLGPLVCGVIGEMHGWRYGFGVAVLGSFLGFAIFLSHARSLGMKPPTPLAPSVVRLKALYTGVIFLLSLGAVPIFSYLIQHLSLVDTLLPIVGIIALIIWFLVIKQAEPARRRKLGIVLCLFFFHVLFYALFEQYGSSVNLFTLRNVDRCVLDCTIPASAFQSVNSGFIIFLGPVFAMMWQYLAQNKEDIGASSKFSLALMQLGLGFGAFYLGSLFANDSGLVGMAWLIIGYFLLTTGELCLAPIGLSLISQAAPRHFAGLMMGIWMLGIAFGQYLGGVLVRAMASSERVLSSYPTSTLPIYAGLFKSFLWISVWAGLALWIIFRNRDARH